MLYHGLSAYNRENRIHDLCRRVYSAQDSVCSWSNMPIGAIGIGATIEHITITTGYPFDCWSSLDTWRGKTTRIPGRNIDYDRVIVEDYPLDRSDVERVIADIDHASERPADHYAEFFATGDADCIWVQRDASKVWCKRARALARLLNLPVVVLDKG